MIFGNPDYFAIYIDKVTDWSYKNFDEGIFSYVLRNKILPKNSFNISSTLGVYHGDLKLLRDNVKNNLLDSCANFNMDDKTLYGYLYYLSFNSNGNQDLRFLISIGDMLDTTAPIFSVSCNEKIKIIYLINEVAISVEFEKNDFLNILDNCIEWMYLNIK